MPPRVRLSVDDLKSLALKHYEGNGWLGSENFDKGTEAFVSKLPRRPELVATYDGMEHLVFLSGRLTASLLAVYKQLLFDVDQSGRPSHIVVVCEESVSTAMEKAAKEMGVGIVIVRSDGDPYRLLPPRLRAFRVGQMVDNLPQRIRTRVQNALRKIESDDVCVGVMDLVQVVEVEMDRVVPVTKSKPFGAKITEAENTSRLNAQAVKAARRINVPRILRAHPGTHIKRRRDIVVPVQVIVDECLALLMAIA